MLKPSRDLVSYLMPLWIWQLHRLLGDGQTNCSKGFLKMFMQVELRISVSNLFHLRITKTTKSETTFNSSLNMTTKLHRWETRNPRKIMWRLFITI